MIGCRGYINRYFFQKKSVSQPRLKVTYMFMVFATSLVVVFFYCFATADILTELLQRCLLFFIVVVIPGQ